MRTSARVRFGRKGGGRGRGAGTRGRVHADPGTRPAREGRHRSLARRPRHPPIGGRAVPSTERPKDVPTEGWPIAAEIDGAAPPAEKRPRAGVLPSPRARPSDRAIESILPETRVRHRTRGVRERRSRIARVPGPSRSRPIRPALDGTAWREKKRVRDHVRRRETATARTARVERARTEVGQVVSHNKDERSGRAVRLMRAGEARASIVRRAQVFVGGKGNEQTLSGKARVESSRRDDKSTK